MAFYLILLKHYEDWKRLFIYKCTKLMITFIFRLLKKVILITHSLTKKILIMIGNYRFEHYILQYNL